MKKFLPVAFLLISFSCFSQKYVLIDKKMAQPLSYTNIVTLEHSYKNFFPVERARVHEFITEVEKIAAILSDGRKPKPEMINVSIGQTKFTGLKIPLAAEERLDVVLTTECDNGTRVNMHLADAKLNNSNNAFFINTWVKYIKASLK